MVLQEGAAEAARQRVGSSQAPKDAENISEMFSESETKARPKIEMRAHCRARPSVVKSLEFKPEERP